jgi:hypothetical protein
MAKAVQEKWGFISASDDVVDAYAAARLGVTISEVGEKFTFKGVSYHGR